MSSSQPPAPLPPQGSAKPVPDAAMAAGGRGGRIAEFVGVLAIFAQVALIALILRKFEIDTSAFRRVVWVAAGGFIVNYLLPIRFRFSFFLALSVATMALILGGTHAKPIADLALTLPRTLAILALGIILIAICHLPIGFWKRAGLLVLAGATIAVFRGGVWKSGNLAIVWPVIAAMFMFRIMVYLYDVASSKQRPPIDRSLAYFFLLPNVCMMLFPVVDFRTFCQKYYDEDALVIYQRGVKWMARGVIQLLLYRWVDRALSIGASDVGNGTDLIRFIITNSFLYLKVSGSFHLCIGVLLLFGFNLPETNHRYFLAASFTDYWRRVNIYWRNFIMKVFFYPAFFRLKKLGQVKALILATLWSFLITWALHLYQTWWITGEASSKWTDVLFWTLLALLVLANSLWELRRGRQRKLATSGYGARDAIGLAIRTAATFAVVSILWSLWSTPNLGEWLFMWSLADLHTLAWGGLTLAGIAAATLLFEVRPTRQVTPDGLAAPETGALGSRFRWEWIRCSVPLFIICVLHTYSHSNFHLPSPFPSPESFDRILVKSDKSSEVVRPVLPGEERGYYESLTQLNWADQQLWEALRREPFTVPLYRVNDFRWNELIPNVHVKRVGAEFETNRWGMRDRDRELQGAPGTIRLALIGSSNVEGWGVEMKDMFAHVIETRLNQEYAKDGHFELLNFATEGVGPLGQSTMLAMSVRRFHPDIVLFFAHTSDPKWTNRDVQEGMREHLPNTYPYLNQILAKAGVSTSTTEKVASERLLPYEPEMLLFAYKQIVQQCHAMNALPVFVGFPLLRDDILKKGRVSALYGLAREAGFTGLIDLSDIYDQQTDFEGLKAAQDMSHGNAKANAIIASNLFERLIANPQIDLLDRARRISESAARNSPTSNPPTKSSAP